MQTWEEKVLEREKGRQEILLKLIRAGEPDEKVREIGNLTISQLEHLKKESQL